MLYCKLYCPLKVVHEHYCIVNTKLKLHLVNASIIGSQLSQKKYLEFLDDQILIFIAVIKMP